MYMASSLCAYRAFATTFKALDFMSDQESVQPCPIKVMDPVPNNMRVNKKSNQKYKNRQSDHGSHGNAGETKRNSHNTKAEISAKKAKLGPKSKKKGLNGP
jgi:hypothetical protein